LGRRGRKALEEPAARYAASRAFPFAQWRERVQLSSVRASAVLADDLGACVARLQSEDPALSGLSGPTLVAASPAIADLVRFWVSVPAVTLRRRAGIL
jgi:hypothetical protein